MKASEGSTYLESIGLGILAGMRTMAAPAVVSQQLADHYDPHDLRRPFNLLASSKVANLLKLFTVGEFIFDKLPGVPNRTTPLPLAARTASGSLAGAALFAADRRRPLRMVWVGALLGGLAALGAAFAMSGLRRVATKKLHLPSPISGAVEDTLVLGAGRALLKQ